MGIKLCGFSGLLSKEVMPGVRLSNEFSGRVKVIACLDDAVNIIHTDELPAHGITAEEKSAIISAMGNRHTDVTVMTWGPKVDVETAMKEIRLRAIDALNGVPSETRQAFADGTSGFERILPGPDRMYPDTDSPPTPITEERVGAIRDSLPQKPWEREARYIADGILPRVAKRLAISKNTELYEKLVSEGHPRKTSALFLIDTLKALSRKGVNTEALAPDQISGIFGYVKANGMSFSVLPKLASIVVGGVDVASAAAENGLTPVSDIEISSFIEGDASQDRFKAAMRHFKGKASPERVRRIIDG